MKTRTKTLLAALMLLAISCKKESNTIQSSAIADENATQASLADANELVAANAVKIGTQKWRKKNLNVTHYRNGDPIPQVKDPAKWAALTTGAWCWYKNDSANGTIYGKLYNWYAVNDPRELAPEGWHIPSDKEWTKLTNFLGGESVAGGKMKSTGTIEAGTGLWYEPNLGATNSSGFAGLPGGIRRYDGIFLAIGHYGYWWSSTEYTISYARSCALIYKNAAISRLIHYKQDGHSVRCVRD